MQSHPTLNLTYMYQPAPDLDNPVPPVYKWSAEVPVRKQPSPEQIMEYVQSFAFGVNLAMESEVTEDDTFFPQPDNN